MSVPLEYESTAVADEWVTALLVGGPEMHGVERVRRVPLSLERIKVEHYGGYEHFHRTGAAATTLAGGGFVYRWADRTRIAE